MATPRDYMLADIAHAFAEVGGVAGDTVIDGRPLRAIVEPLDIVPGEFEGAVKQLRAVWLEKGAMPLPRPGYRLTMDGEEWTVQSVDPTGLVDILYLAKYE